MEELTEGLLKAIMRLLGVVIRALIWLIVECFFEIVAWYVGWPICRVCSLGRYPQQSINDHEQASTLIHFVVSLIGIISLIALATLIAIMVGSG